MKLGFIGQGIVGKIYADLFEKRGFEVVRYAKEEPYINNKEKIKDCDIVFIAVPTPTTPKGFDDSVVRQAVNLVGKGKIAVIRSTVIPGTTRSIQEEYPQVFVLHVPEFLTARVALEDAEYPKKNIVGIPKDDEIYRQKAGKVLEIFPVAPHQSIVKAEEAEMVKYIQNNFLFLKNVYMGIIWEFVEEMGLNRDAIASALLSDPLMGTYHHLTPRRNKDRRYGAAGECLPKDFEAFLRFHEERSKDEGAKNILRAIRDRNIEELKKYNKSLDILRGIYGDII